MRNTLNQQRRVILYLRMLFAILLSMFNRFEGLRTKMRNIRDASPAVEEKDYQKLYTTAQTAFEQQRKKLTVQDKPPLSHQQHTEISLRVDEIFARGIKKYLPPMLEYCQTAGDLAGLFTGLVIIDEIKGVPYEALPFLGRGLYVAPYFVVEEPEKVENLLSSLNVDGLPTGKIRDYFFRKQNTAGGITTCPGMRSACEVFKILSDNPIKSKEMVANGLELPFLS